MCRRPFLPHHSAALNGFALARGFAFELTHTHTRASAHTCTKIRNTHAFATVTRIHIGCTHEFIHTHSLTHKHTHTHTHTQTHTHTHACIHSHRQEKKKNWRIKEMFWFCQRMHFYMRTISSTDHWSSSVHPSSSLLPPFPNSLNFNVRHVFAAYSAYSLAFFTVQP